MLQRALFSLLLAVWVGCMDELQVGSAHDAGLNADGGASVDDLLDDHAEEIAGAWAPVDRPDELVITFKPDPDPARPRSGTFAFVCRGCPPAAGPPKPPELLGAASWTGTYNLFAIEGGLAYGTVYPKPDQVPPILNTLSAFLKYDPGREKITWLSKEWTRTEL